MRRLTIILVLLALFSVVVFFGGRYLSDKPAAVDPQASPAADAEVQLCSFETTDLDGNAWDSSIFADYKLTMINLWEPWCGPCVAEMPDLQKLYEDYADKGFMLLGVFSMEAGVAETITDTGVSYPMLHYTSGFDSFQTGYVPTTIMVNSKGELVGGPYVGINSYEGWAAIIESLL